MYIYGFLLLIVLSIWLPGCSSPEAQRQRSGGPGADIGNRGKTVQLHGDVSPEQSMFYQTPQFIVPATAGSVPQVPQGRTPSRTGEHK